MKRLFLIISLFVLVSNLASAQQGGISAEMLDRISSSYTDNSYDKAISNALAGTSIATLAINADNAAMIASAGYCAIRAGKLHDMSLNAAAVLDISH